MLRRWGRWCRPRHRFTAVSMVTATVKMAATAKVMAVSTPVLRVCTEAATLGISQWSE